MDTPTTGSQFLEIIQQARAEWNALLEPIDQSKITLPGVAGTWSLKDIIAHITWHEREMVGLIRAHDLVGSELWNLPTDERNALQHGLAALMLLPCRGMCGAIVKVWSGRDSSPRSRSSRQPPSSDTVTRTEIGSSNSVWTMPETTSSSRSRKNRGACRRMITCLVVTSSRTTRRWTRG